ncbi:hypothetical protein [Methanobacterium alcaliphilum]|uniref:hypothetical protein n=1 Tax=Methanobacterium alcaliphilum TaxID=392018 RepID=UPI002009FC52|nr:hypothetical protein [Methanobacterium alcaliphilum]MCK9151680.1 hypothetical protein [Methanobacterium alcaliphilum]
MNSFHTSLKIGLIGFLLFAGVLVLSSLSCDSSMSFATDSATKVLLGENNLGKVEKIGPYGNASSKTKIAYIVGVHPLEKNTHSAVYSAIKSKDKSLKYRYYIYKVTVTKDAKNYSKGRMNGQILANKYVVNDIKKQKYDLVIDVHSNRGYYAKKRFLFAPKNYKYSKKIAGKIISKISWLSYHNPKKQTSPQYVTIPIVKSGIKTLVYEDYMYQKYALSKKNALRLVRVVDTLKL